MLTIHEDGSLVIWDAANAARDVERGAIERRLRTSTGSAYRVAVTRDGRFAAVASSKDIQFIDVERDETVWTTNVISRTDYDFSVGAVEITHDSRFVICGSSVSSFSRRGGFIAILDATTGRELRRFAAHSDSITSLLPLPDGRFASGSSDHSIKVWDPESESTFVTASGHDSTVGGVALSTDGRYAISALSIDR